MPATLIWFSGAETGSPLEITAAGFTFTGSIVASPVRTGAYALQIEDGQTAQVPFTGTQTAITTYVRFYAYVTGTPAAAGKIYGSGNGAKAFRLYWNTNGTLGWAFNSSSQIAVGGDALLLSQWNLVEFRQKRDAAVGGMELYLNGVLQFSSFSTNTTTNTINDRASFYFTQEDNVSGRTVVFDDMAIGTGAYIGAGQCVKVQGKAGAPTYDTWTKTGDTTAALCWSETPSSATKNCSSGTTNNKQTMLVDSVALNAAVAAAATINGAMVVAIGKGGTTTELLRRVASADTASAACSVQAATDTFIPKGSGTSEVMGVFTASRADLGAAEIGIVKSSASGTTTVEDVWLMVDYTPPPPVLLSLKLPEFLEALRGLALALPAPLEISGATILSLTEATPLEALGWVRLAVPLSIESFIALKSRLPIAVEAGGGPLGAMIVTFRVAAPTFDPLRATFSVRESGEVMGALDVTFDVLEACDAGLEVTFFVLEEALFNLRMHETHVAPHVEVLL